MLLSSRAVAALASGETHRVAAFREAKGWRIRLAYEALSGNSTVGRQRANEPLEDGHEFQDTAWTQFKEDAEMNAARRTFLKAAAAATLVPTLSTALHASQPPVVGPGSLPLPVNLPKTGLKIVSVDTFTRDPLGFVCVTTDDGSTGWGQMSTYDADISATVMHRKIARHALGKDPADINSIVDRCIEANYKYPWSFINRALSGLDTAIWDLLAKKHDKSVCELLGGSRKPIRAYGSSMSRTIKPADEAARLADLQQTSGFTAFKIRIGSVCGHDKDQWPGRTEQIVPAVRKAIGDQTSLLVDANSCYTPGKAIEIGRQLLKPNNVCHFEEPCPWWELEWTAEVAAALDTPVAGGEQDNDLAQWRRMLKMHAVDIAQPDILYIGGITRALRVAKMAENLNIPCVPHAANLGLVTLFTMHLLAAIPNAGPYLEFSIESTPWSNDAYQPALQVTEGHVNIPEAPGWGVKISDPWLQKTKKQTTSTN